MSAANWIGDRSDCTNLPCDDDRCCGTLADRALRLQPVRQPPMLRRKLRALHAKNQMTLRGVHSLTPSDYQEIVEQLIEQLTELELKLGAREIAQKREP
jgi:hypothetical protein